MAEGKKSFVLYSDLLPTIKKLVEKDRKNKTNNAGELFLHLLEYVCDNNPEPINDTVDLMFEPIKTTLKRDLQKWEVRSERSRENGAKGGRPPKYENLEKPKETQQVILEPKKPDSVNDSVSVNENGILLEKETKVNISERKQIFYNSLIPFTETYGKVMLREFYEYWTEHGEKDLKFRKEKEKTFGIERRLKTWSNNNFNKNTGNGKQFTSPSKKPARFSIARATETLRADAERKQREMENRNSGC